MKDRGSFVYVFTHPSGPIKIGFSISPEERLSQLQAGSPVRLECAFTFACGERHARAIERAVHEKFACRRKSGEWFDVLLVEAMAAIKEAEKTVDWRPIGGPESGQKPALAAAPPREPQYIWSLDGKYKFRVLTRDEWA